MSTVAYETISEQIDMLSYSDRLRLLNRIVQSLGIPKENKEKTDSNPEDVFGLWRDRDISVDSIRKTAWGRN